MFGGWRSDTLRDGIGRLVQGNDLMTWLNSIEVDEVFFLRRLKWKETPS